MKPVVVGRTSRNQTVHGSRTLSSEKVWLKRLDALLELMTYIELEREGLKAERRKVTMDLSLDYDLGLSDGDKEQLCLSIQKLYGVKIPQNVVVNLTRVDELVNYLCKSKVRL